MSVVQVHHTESGTEEVRYRLVPWQLAMPFSVIFLGACAQAVRWLIQSQPSAAESHQADTAHAVLYAVGAVLVLLILLETRRFGVTLTPTEIRVHNLRSRVIRWSDVRAVTTESLLGTRFVILHEADRRTRLRAPSTGFLSWDRGFDLKYQIIEQWWLTHRGPADSWSAEG
jgi:hypothetical protein